MRVAGVEGVVEDFGLRRTTLRGLDGALHIVPNGQILVATLAALWARITLDLTVSADADRDRVRTADRARRPDLGPTPTGPSASSTTRESTAWTRCPTPP